MYRAELFDICIYYKEIVSASKCWEDISAVDTNRLHVRIITIWFSNFNRLVNLNKELSSKTEN